MPVKEVPIAYESHGQTFPTREAAERHSALIEAREQLESAQRKFQRLLAENAVTADGKPFHFGMYCDYWQVFQPWNSLPYLRKFCFICDNWRVRGDIDRPDVVEICGKSDRGNEMIWVPITELFCSQEKAEAELLAARRKWLAEKAAEIEESERAKRKGE